MDSYNVFEWKCPPSLFPASPKLPIKARRFHFTFVRWLWAAQQHIHFSGPGVNLTQCNPPAPTHTEPEESSLQQFARKSSLHGLVHVVDNGTSQVQQCLWTFVFIGCINFLVTSGIVYYFQFPHITKLEEKVAPEKTFPALTFCNINPLRKSTLTACDIEHLREIWHIPAEHIENTSPMYELNGESFKYFIGTKAEMPCCGQFDWKRLYDHSAHRLWDMVQSCRFKKADCTAEDFESVSNFLACLWT